MSVLAESIVKVGGKKFELVRDTSWNRLDPLEWYQSSESGLDDSLKVGERHVESQTSLEMMSGSSRIVLSEL